MIDKTINDIRRNRAIFMRDIEYAREGVLEDEIDERLEVALNEAETVDELTEAAATCNKIAPVEDEVAESEEIDRILNSETDMTFDQMIGIEE